MNNILKAKWQKGKATTLSFYKSKLPLKTKSFNHKFELPDYFNQLINGKKEVVIAELGAGMFCTIGSTWKTAKVKIYPSDILADEYNQILKNHGIDPFMLVEKQDMDKLTYPDNFFDIVHCCNALDHTFNPIKAIKEMYRICKPDGFIYLRHAVNVGKRQNYNGLHLWNLELDQSNDLIIWNPESQYSLRSMFPGLRIINSIEKESDCDKVISILQKA